MKIAFIGQKGIPAISGGVEKHVEKLATRLAAQGHEVFVYVRAHYTHIAVSEYKGVRLVHVPSIPTKHLDAFSHSLFSTLHALFQDYTVIHYHSIGPGVLALLPRLLKPGTHVVATFHTRDYFHKKWNFLARFWLRVSEYITCYVPEKVIVISETLAAYARTKYGRDFVFIPNGAEVEAEPDPTPLRAFGLRPKRYVLSVSRLVEHKGIHYLIKAFQELEHRNKMPNNFKLAIVGSHAYTADYERYLKVLAADNPNILFLGEQRGKNLSALFTQASIFVQPSEEEGLSLALLEAMAYGLPVIVSNIPANREAVKKNCGAVFEVRNIESLKKELGYYINRPAEARELGRAAKKRAEACYGWDAIAERTLEVYESLLKLDSLKHHAVPQK